MDGTSLSSHSSSSEQEPQSHDDSTLQGAQEHSDAHTVTSAADEVLQGDRLLSEEEQVTLITESMSITSADEEKLLLLNRNTELRRLNKELMKLNEDWDHIYRSTTLALEQRLAAIEQESATLKQINHRLLLKVEHEQSKREYYEQTLLQELKKNQHLQEYVRLLEARLHHTDTDRDWPGGALNGLEVARPPEIAGPLEPPRRQGQGPSCYPPLLGSPPAVSDRKSRTQTNRRGPFRETDKDGVTLKEVQELKEQLEALRCQTQIYEADYKTEHKDRQRMVLENKKLRRKEGDMRQQMALLQEQLKVYEDDFRKERSDKQVLQRLLMKKVPVNDPILIHRCNNDHDRPAGGERDQQKEREKGGDQARPRDRHVRKAECPHHPCLQRHAEGKCPAYSADYS
ncbi:TNFAIP3-interacting protein 3 [Anguilla rostrata]|uniref:TNFAIP3-interacting protein 3 n=1 Tax=Anguilla rostrata TaxID=7938 RepID=UPI0030D26D49